MKYVLIKNHGRADDLWLALVNENKVVMAMRHYKLQQSRSGWRAYTPQTSMLFQGEGAKTLARTWLESQHVLSCE